MKVQCECTEYDCSHVEAENQRNCNELAKRALRHPKLGGKVYLCIECAEFFEALGYFEQE